MLKSKAKWEFSEANNGNSISASVMERLFHERGLFAKEEQQNFLHPKLEHLETPLHLQGITKAKERVFEAIENEEEILVYGDYDADGITSTALMVSVLRELGASCDFYIPDRFTEGYGLHRKALERFHKQGFSLVITVDNGIANAIEADYAKTLGLDLIITDHHEVQEEIPEAVAVIHPALSTDYSFKHLAGVGVAFQFAHCLLEEKPTNLLDLVAIGTIADLVPLIGENRIFASFGLKQLANTENIGLQALKQLCSLHGEVTARDVGFLIAPRLNAVGRLQNAKKAVDLLLTDSFEEAEDIAGQIQELNEERQQIVSKMVKEAERQVDEKDDFIILYDREWHEGVLGIAASRLANKFHRPVMMLAYKEETEELKGSARSIPAYDLFKNGMKIRHLFTKFGGHAQAAGMAFPFENLEEMKEQLNESIAKELTEEDFKPFIKVSASIEIGDITEDLIRQIALFAPFGMDNEEPIFHFAGRPSQLRQIGQDKSHLKLQFVDKEHRVEAIGFGLGHLYPFISPYSELDIVGKLQINEWNGNRTPQALIEDIAIKQWQLLDFRGKKSVTNINSYIGAFKRNVVVANKTNKTLFSLADEQNVMLVTYDEDISRLEKSDIVYVYDLPEELETLQNIIERTSPKFIHVSYHITDSAYLTSIPPREDFKWLYAYLFKNYPIHLNVDLPVIIERKRWTKEKIVFMLKVFLDLKFISIEKNVLYVNRGAEKRELHTAKTYRKRLKRGKIEKTLYYSTYEELREWFSSHLHIDGLYKEEMLHEL